MSEKIEMSVNSDQSWMEVFPFGVTLSADEVRPIFIFRDVSEKISLPIWLSPLDAGISLSQEFQSSVPATPHRLTYKVLSEMGLFLESCFFVEIKGHTQIVELKFKGQEQLKVFRHRADECISFCLFAKTQFFASSWFVEKSRELHVDIESMQKGLKLEPGISRNHHPYMM